jgi:transglutaminase-like putative cysteine protease
MNVMSEDQRSDLPALYALVALDLVAAACLGRLFTDATPLGPILAAVLVGHATALVCRVRAFSASGTAMTIAAVGLLLMVWFGVPAKTFYGLPTIESLRAVGDALSRARHDFGVAVAPAKVTPGFTMACVFAVVNLAGLADWAAFRMRTSIEAAIPAFTVFVFAAMLGTTRHRAAATIAFVAALAFWFVTHNATVIARMRPWFGGTAERGRRALSRAGFSLGTLALVGTLVGLAIPFTHDPPAAAWRKHNQDHARTTISPLVDIRARLVSRSDVIAFTVQTPVKSYWRLTALDVFDGEIWSSHGNYSEVKPNQKFGDRNGTLSAQHFTIGDLRSIWVPAAYRPVTAPSIDGISYDSDADAFITDQDNSDKLDYSVSSVVPALTPDALRKASAGRVDKSQLAVPNAVDPRVALLAQQITQTKTNAYDKALAIQKFFRSPPFVYDLNVQPGHSDSAIVDFLFRSHRGYCEQYAGSYAVLARLAGLPARVAVGFTPGDFDPSRGTYTVREIHAHAWPEVYLGSAGWVAFEPTPGRGMPGAQAYTGAAEAQADTRRPSTASTAVPTTVANDASQPGGIAPQPTTTTTATTPPHAVPAHHSFPWRIIATIGLVILVLGAVISAVPLTVAARRRRRFRAARSPEERVLVAWNDTDEALRFAGAAVRPSDTPAQRLATVAEVIGAGGVATMERLANTVDVAAYAPVTGLTETDATTARADAEAVRRAAFASRGTWEQIVFSVDPRRLKKKD